MTERVIEVERMLIPSDTNLRACYNSSTPFNQNEAHVFNEAGITSNVTDLDMLSMSIRIMFLVVLIPAMIASRRHTFLNHQNAALLGASK